jgi:hypothetical protein
MSTKSKAQRKLVEKQKIEKSMSPTEKKIKDFIQDMIEYYKTQKKKEDKKEAKAFTYNILSKRDLMINMNITTEYMVKVLGPELYISTVELDSIQRDYFFLKKHKISSKERTHMVGWMMEIFASYPSEPLSFFLSVEIMDNYLQKTEKKYNEKDLHLIGMVAVYMASKMEDLIPLHMIHIKTKIGHDRFTQEEIILMEKDMLKILNWDLMFITTYDVVKIFLSDFYVNNKDMINNLKMNVVCYDLEIISIFLCKLLCLHEAFFKYSKCIMAISIIIASFDIFRSNYNITKETENFLRQWLLFLVKESKFPVDNVTKVYNKICAFYEDIESINKISSSLCKLYNLRELIKDIK